MTPTTKTVNVFLATLVVIFVILVPATASAAFTRPFLRQVTGTSSGPFGDFGPLGVAVDSEDNLWVGDNRTGQPPFQLDQFESAELGNPFSKALEIEGLEPPPVGLTLPQSLAVDGSDDSFYVAGSNTGSNSSGYVEVFDEAGAFVKRFGPMPKPTHVTVDNSSEPSAGTVYVARTSDGLSEGSIGKFNASGEPVDFSLSEELGHPSYVSANQLTGRPGENFSFDSPQALAVDTRGDIYVVDPRGGVNPEVDEYASSGLFLRTLDGSETPGLAEREDFNGFGGSVEGIAVDPVNDHVLIAVSRDEYEKQALAAVDEFDASGQFLKQITGTSAGQRLHGVREMTVDSHGNLYLVDRTQNSPAETTPQHAVDVYGTGHFLPTLSLAEASERQSTAAILNGSVDPEEHSLTECAFEYVTEAAFDATGFGNLSSGGKAPCTPSAASIPADSETHHVEAHLESLSAGTTYRYRLTATSSGELGGSAASASLAFTAPHAPAVDTATADNLSSNFADLRARIRPLGAATSYYFQYVDAAHYQAATENPYAGGATVPAAPSAIGAGGPGGGAASVVLQHLGGLAPSTTYHFRVLATNQIGTTTGPDRIFATLPEVSPGLPDDRGYEMLTPPGKPGAEDMFARPNSAKGEFSNTDVGYPSDSGNGFLFETRAAFGPFPFSLQNAYVISRNPASGWRATSLAAPAIAGVQVVTAFNTVFNPSDLSRVGFGDGVGSPASAAGKVFTTQLGVPGGPYSALSADSTPVHITDPGAPVPETTIAGSSRDLGHVVLESTNRTLAPGATTQTSGSHALYESVNGASCEPHTSHCALVNVGSDGKLLSRCGALLGLGGLNGGSSAVSAEGARVIFTAPDPTDVDGGTGCWDGAQANVPQLYSRSAGVTVKVSEPQAGVSDPSGSHPALYVGASADGSKVFFISEAELTPTDEGIHDPEIYMYDFTAPAGERLVRISAGETVGAGAGVWTVPAISADGSSVYFTATGRLVTSAPETEGEEVNLYRYDTVADDTTYVATVNKTDYPGDVVGSWWKRAGVGDHLPNAFALYSKADWDSTPDGRYLLFGSSRELLGNSTLAAPGVTCQSPGYAPNGHCSELYRFDSLTGNLACVSCNPSGTPPASKAEISRSAPGMPSSLSPRGISDDASYVFFDTADSLVPQDTNSTLDVYEWHGGRVALISSGHDSAPSFFLGSSADGSNVFFGTHARLVPADTDPAGDLYDARICTDSDPCLKQATSKEGICEGDACSHPVEPPVEPTLSSSVPSGVGNQRPGGAGHKPCGKGKVRKHGKCVRKKRGARKRQIARPRRTAGSSLGGTR